MAMRCMCSHSPHQLHFTDSTLAMCMCHFTSPLHLTNSTPLDILQHWSQLPEATIESVRCPFWKGKRQGNQQSWRTIINTFYELEAEFVEHFQKLNGTVRTIDPLLPPEAFEDRPCRISSMLRMGFNKEEDMCLEWLDMRKQRQPCFTFLSATRIPYRSLRWRSWRWVWRRAR
jgi:hypothetical protein